MNKKEIIEMLNNGESIPLNFLTKKDVLAELESHRYIIVDRTENKTIYSIRKGKNFAKAVKEYLD